MVLSLLASLLALAPVPVKVVQTGANYTLLRAGKPYFIKGAAGDTRLDMLEKLKQCGGNSIRTWGADNLEGVLDDAEKLGLTVTIGIWLGHSEHGFRWNNAKAVEDQFRQAQVFVRRYRNHPAVLAWALGNEMEGGADASLLWPEVDRMAKMVKVEDPNHPVMTVVAEIDKAKVDAINKLAPTLDLVGINSYGGLINLGVRAKEFGLTKPYVVTEFGPRGPWESGKSPSGSPLEPTSGEKALIYRDSYRASVAGQPGKCLGSYAFLWGQKQEQTPTWFGMWLATGERTAAVDVMQAIWSGKAPAEKCPEITALTIETTSAAAKSKLKFSFKLAEGSSKGSQFTFQVGPDSSDELVTVEPLLQSSLATYAGECTAPTKPGKYRLYVTVRDGKWRAGTANFPFEVK